MPKIHFNGIGYAIYKETIVATEIIPEILEITPLKVSLI